MNHNWLRFTVPLTRMFFKETDFQMYSNYSLTGLFYFDITTLCSYTSTRNCIYVKIYSGLYSNLIVVFFPINVIA